MKSKRLNIFPILLVFALMMTMAGCSLSNKSGQTIDEPDITPGYLENEYKEQILRDGASEIFGSAKIDADDNGVKHLTLYEKEFVKDKSYPNGFYIADKNRSFAVSLPNEARITFLTEGSAEPQVMSPDEFIAADQRDEANFNDEDTKYYDTKLYYFYLFDDQVLLMLAQYIP